MSDQHVRMCPVMADDARCVTVGGTSTHHDRGRAGDCRCGVKCQCELVNAVRADERERSSRPTWSGYLDRHFADLRAKVRALKTRGVGARVIDGELVTYALVERDEVLALFGGGSDD